MRARELVFCTLFLGLARPVAAAEKDGADEEVVVESAAPVPWADGTAEEVVVWGDLFARWDNTRWLIATELAMPYALPFAKNLNEAFPCPGFQIRTILACSKTWKLNNRHWEVDCVIED